MLMRFSFYWSPDTENKICKIGRRLGFHLYYSNNWQQFFVHVCNGRLGMNAGSRPTLGPAIPFENLLPGQLCQSVDLFGILIIFTFFTSPKQICRRVDINHSRIQYCHYSKLFRTSKWLQFPHFSNFSSFSWPFFKFGVLSTKRTRWA